MRCIEDVLVSERNGEMLSWRKLAPHLKEPFLIREITL
jgi:hypothetical protein